METSSKLSDGEELVLVRDTSPSPLSPRSGGGRSKNLAPELPDRGADGEVLGTVPPTLLAPVTLPKVDDLMASRSSTSSLPAPATEGLGALDRDRAASVADEGGTAAAAVETQDVEKAGQAESGNRTWRKVSLETIGAPRVWRLVSRLPERA